MNQKGFSLIELLIVVVLVGLIAALAVPSYEKAVDAARIARAIGDIKAVEREVLLFDALSGHLPSNLAKIGRADLTDPWQHPYVYLSFFVETGTNGTGGGNGQGTNGNGGNHGNNGQAGNMGGNGQEVALGSQVPPQVQGLMRRDRNLVPLNSRFDLYSMGKDGESRPPITAQVSWDDIIRANDGSFVGLASNY